MSLNRPLQHYWVNYGGHRAVLKSPFFWFSITLALITFPYWTKSPWWQLSLDILPNLLGFSLGGFALIIGFGSERFLNLIAGRTPGEPDPSPYMETVASFFHFILVQSIGLTIAAVAQIFSNLSSFVWFTPINEILKPIFYYVVWLMGSDTINLTGSVLIP